MPGKQTLLVWLNDDTTLQDELELPLRDSHSQTLHLLRISTTEQLGAVGYKGHFRTASLVN